MRAIRAREALDALFSPACPLPLDCFRVLFGMVAAGYFLHLLLEAADFSAPDGLLDHAITREMFWYTRLSLFYPGMPLELVQGAFLAAAAASLALSAGIRPRLAALFMFVVAVSTYRLNFLVFYWDDGLMHLVMFWLVLLPTGTTLTLRDWRRYGRNAWQRWRETTVPGATVRCFAWNLTLIYFVSGLWKLTSRMWLEGDALFVTLQTPAAYSPDLWWAGYQPLYRLGNYATLVVELLSPLFLVLRPGHWLKWTLLVLLLGFHLGIIATLRVPYSNIALLFAIVLLFRDEVMTFLRAGTQTLQPQQRAITFGGVFALAFVVLLTVATTRFLPGLQPVRIAGYDRIETGIDARAVGGLTAFHKALYATLWFLGIAQEYQLFNWIDMRNYTVRYEIVRKDPFGAANSLDPRDLFPASTRSVLLQAYLHDLVWFRIPAEQRERLKDSLARRVATRYCRQIHLPGEITVTSRLMRIHPDGALSEERAGALMQFDCGPTAGGTLAHMH